MLPEKMRITLLTLFCLIICSSHADAQGTWTKLTNTPPDYFNGVALLMTDGSVLVKSCAGGLDSMGNRWDKLTPDTNGSYINGTWTRLSNSHSTRLYCSSQVLKDGRVYVAGGEFGTGHSNAEVYNPLNNSWDSVYTLPSGYDIYDGNSELLPDGKVLQNIVLPFSGTWAGFRNCIYDPVANNYSWAATCLGGADEAAWLKLPDSSILYVDIASNRSERYIPSLNVWLRDDTVPVLLYDTYGEEEGGSLLLPDGRAFFIGSTSTSAFYTPSGDTSHGTWTAGPIIPDSLGAPDASAAMMPNGKILCAFSKQATAADEYPFPTWFYEFDYTTNTFTKVSSPIGGDTIHIMCYETGMLVLPDGNILMGILDSNQLYVYHPGGTPVASGIPVVNNVYEISCDTFMATGTLFNGISQGAVYGDDWQMPTNYPIIKLMINDSTPGTIVHYARTFNWNRTGVMTGSLPDTTYFTLPAGLPYATYNLEVTANGISSLPVSFTPCNRTGITQVNSSESDHFVVYPNPATGLATVSFGAQSAGRYSLKIVDVLGRTIIILSGEAGQGNNSILLQTGLMAKGVYTVVLNQDNRLLKTKLVIE